MFFRSDMDEISKLNFLLKEIEHNSQWYYLKGITLIEWQFLQGFPQFFEFLYDVTLFSIEISEIWDDPLFSCLLFWTLKKK